MTTLLNLPSSSTPSSSRPSSPSPPSAAPPPPAEATRPHPRSLLTPALLPHLATLQSLESSLSQDLHALLSDRSTLDTAHTQLRKLLPRIQAVEGEVSGINQHGGGEEGLVGRIGKVNEIAERIGGKVRGLDEELLRVREAGERLNEVMELKTSLETLRGGIRSKDWETAARACKRALHVPTEVIEGGFAARVVPTTDDPSPPSQALQTLRSELLEIFQSQFRTAATARDEVAVSRFFRLWPEIGAETEGLQAYGDFVVGLVRGRNMAVGKTSSPLYYITHLTALFESIGLIVDQHQPVVEKYYGPGRTRSVVGRLQEEGDRVLESLVSGWEEERRVGRMLTATLTSPPIRSSHQPTVQPSSLSATLSSTHLPSLPNAATSLLNTYNPTRRVVSATSPSSTAAEEDTGPDPREIDKVLGELTGMAGRWGLYRRFLWGRLRDDPTPSAGEGSGSPKAPPPSRGLSSAGTVLKEIEGAEVDHLSIVEDSESKKLIEGALKKFYEPMEVWYLRSSIDKALRLDTPDTTSKPHLSSCPDDTFYLLKLILYRLVASSSLPTLEHMAANIAEIMERDYIGGIKRKMDGVYAGVRSAGAQNAVGGGAGGGKGAEAERLEREMRGSFVIYANDLDVSAEHVERLVQEVLGSDAVTQSFLDEEVDAARDAIKSLESLAGKCRTILKTGTDQLFNQLVRPRLRPFLDDCYKGVTYTLDEEAYAEAEFQDIVRKRFVRGWDALVEGYRASFTDTNYNVFFATSVEVLVRPWEKMIFGMKFTELGALRFDRDLRSIANFLSSQTAFGGSREKFIRLQQISTVLNLGSDEDAKEFWGQSGIPWRLSRSEYDSVAALRI
ncbi:COG4 transport protein-domain-containing protein [Mrakia frigida]|uniref:Golgi transport complex subunit COG4 n=1 Tax=Mrakia frigida TaxID=29902 RepID=UPI003FCBF9E2